ncbi:aminoglycoside phosphotransferase [Cytophagaceae bacterium DM2B3-1]|uniref:Aminoglycoside phosphotransferase n=1 Tax=Xanthocytophaga flava TaxID=3048013 RepID=A0ABT7D272_9BACT|nr:aminoglycoside phosphotransferase [Xanthocytophaga flavus]MDJ1470849.1 aminoglycoside phosphotransferase [Xanthocytophaga flavus]MDJ1498879.1 aminoglycoside phosphotransferase [Xanthocytophaga flavus]
MIKLPNTIAPASPILAKLQEYQDEIDRLTTFTERSEKAKAVFGSRNKIGNTVFDAIKVKLSDMCSGARRCVYCEDSVGDEVEHIRPKDLYPGVCFSWTNYVYACGNCNGPKNNKFAVFRHSDGQFVEVNPPRGQQAAEPPAGDDALINPRIEDPFAYCMLDLISTFQFVITAPAGTPEHQKAEYTINTVLRLNEREFLRKSRRSAFENYKARLYQYVHKRNAGASAGKLQLMREGIQTEAHPTVWKEMQRYHRRGILRNVDPDLDDLFLAEPNALNW